MNMASSGSALVPDVHSVLIWSARWDAGNGQAIVTKQVVEGQSNLYWIPAVYSSGRFRSITSTLRAAGILWSELLRGRSRTVYLVCSRSTGGFFRDIPALLAARIGTRVIIHAHGSDIVDLLFRRRYSVIARFFYRQCELIVPSKHLVPAMKRLMCKQLNVCENFLPIAPYAKPFVGPDEGQILHVLWNSNILSSKGFFDVAKGIHLGRERGLDIRLTTLGKPLGDTEKNLAEVTAELDLLSKYPWIKNLGHVSPEEAVQRTAEADLIPLPSHYASECQPLALVQAMCLGKQIIAANTSALRETLRNYPAILINEPTPESISIALEVVLQSKAVGHHDETTQFSRAAEKARDRFSVTRFNTQMAKILGSATISSPDSSENQ